MSTSKLIDLFKSVESGDCIETKLYDELQQGISSRAYNILEIVESLGILLVNKETVLRKKGTEILSKYLAMLDKNHLNEHELEFVVAFYCDRLKDHHSIIPEVLLGLYHLCDMNQLPQDTYSKLFPAVFVHFNCQSQLIQDRKMFYEILLKCMKHNVEGLKPMGPDFVYGVIQSIDGERDPRNLMFLFTTFIPLFFNNFELYHLHEEMFDIMACYFPVDFRPKENDPDAISREDLSTALTPNLLAKPAFVEFCIPLALEKLESDLKVAKLDSLILLTNACYKFPKEKISERTKNIWTVVKNNLTTEDADVKQKLIELLHAMLTVLPDDEVASLFQTIYNHVKYSLSTNVDKALFVSNTKMLVAICKDSKVCMKQVAILLIPILYIEINKTYNDEYIQMLNGILEICSNNLDISLSELTELSITWNDLLDLYFKLCVNSDDCLHGLTILHSYLNFEQRKCIYKILNDGIRAKSLSDEFQDCLCTFAKHYKDDIFEHIIHPLKNEIIEKTKDPNVVPNADNVKENILENLKLNNPDVYTKDEPDTGFMKPLAYRRGEENEEIPIFVAICPPARIVPTEEIFIKNLYCPLIRLDSYLKELSADVIGFLVQETASESCFRYCTTDYVANISLLKFILETHENEKDILHYFEDNFSVCEKVMKIYFDNVSDESYYSSFVLDCIAILNNIWGSQSNTALNNTKLIENILEAKDIRLMILIPLFNKASFKSSDLILQKVKHLSNTLLDIAISTQDTFINKYASILLSIIINNVEHLESNEIGVNIQTFLSKILSVQYNNNVSILHAYITKALIVKGYTNIEPWLQTLVDHLKNYQMGKNVVESLKIIIHEDNIKENHYQYKNVKFLYRQRLFMFCLEKLLKNVSNLTELEPVKDSACVENKIVKLNNYLAILIQLKPLPKQIIVSHIKTLLPIMIECLSLICDTQLGGKYTDAEKISQRNSSENINKENNLVADQELGTYCDTINFDDALHNLLELFVEFMKTKLEILHEYVNSFVDKFLYVAQHHSNLNHRITALQCLYYLSYFDVIKLMPFKNKVIEGLKIVLDDHKRLVRKQAVTTIDRWYILDSAEDE